MAGAHELKGYDHLEDGTEESFELHSFPPEVLLTPNHHVLLPTGKEW